MKVVKRDGRSEEVKFDKILRRNQVLCATPEALTFIDPESDLYQILKSLRALENADATFITQQAIKGVYDGVTTQELDVHSAMIAQSLALIHPDYAGLAARLAASNLQKNVLCRIISEFGVVKDVVRANLFLYVTRALWQNRDVNGRHAPLVAPYFRAVVEKNHEWLSTVINYTRDYNFDYMGYSILEKSYLMKTLLDSSNGRREIIEQPQHLFMRVAIGIECAPTDPVGPLRTAAESQISSMMSTLADSLAGDLSIAINTEHLRANLGSFLETTIMNSTKQNAEAVFQSLMSDPDACVLTDLQKMHIQSTYDMMSLRLGTHATPTLFNAGSLRPQCSSCYLIGPTPDSMEGITDVWRSESLISKWAGGIGSIAYSLRPKGSYISGTNGTSNGLVPKLKVDNDIATYVDQGGNIRPGSNAVYNSAWHGDIFAFLDLRKERGVESERARELFYGMWLSDEFMRSVIHKRTWYLMCPNQCPGLYDVYDHCLETEWLEDEYVNNHKESFAFTHLYRSYVQAGKYMREVPATDIWRAICDAQIETGLPYMLYKDSVNRKSNQGNAGTIKSSNLCVAPETQILTRDGYREISTLEDQEIDVWNGEEWSKTTVRQTGIDEPLLHIKFSNGETLDCTKEHKFYVQNSYHKPAVEVRAKDLKSGDKLIKYNLPVIHEGEYEMKYPYMHGAFCGDGTYLNVDDEPKNCEFGAIGNTNYCGRHQYWNGIPATTDGTCQATLGNQPILYLYDDKKSLLPEYTDASLRSDIGNRMILRLPQEIEDKFFVPMNAPIETKVLWLAGYLDMDGTIAKNGSNLSIQASCINKQFIVSIKHMLQTMGVDSKVTKMHGGQARMMPDGRGGLKEYMCKKIYRLLIPSSELVQLIELGFAPKRLKLNNFVTPQRNAKHFVKITSVQDKGRVADTFCFTERIRHMGMFNGILAGNCTEIVEFTNNEETAVCNLTSVCLNNFWDSTRKEMDWDKFRMIVRTCVYNLNRVIDLNFYPTMKTYRSNLRHRPMGIGVQGLADLFAIRRVPIDSTEARQINFEIFERLYYYALEMSCEIAQVDGPYPSYDGSPISRGQFQFDLWMAENARPRVKTASEPVLAFDLQMPWDNLRTQIAQYGVRNSLLIAPMPTASTANIMGNSRGFEPYNSTIYKRPNKSGEFVIINKHLVRDLLALGIWDEDMRSRILGSHGGIQEISSIPLEIRKLYKTVWDLGPKVSINLALDRAVFIDQSQSKNLHVAKPTVSTLSQIQFYSWKRGAKTGSYYIWGRPPIEAQKTQIKKSTNKMLKKAPKPTPEKTEVVGPVCTMEDGCLTCGS